MRYARFLLLVYVVVANCGCVQRKEKPDKPVFSVDWSTVKIVSENRVVINITNDDTTKIKTYSYGSFFGGYHKATSDSVKAFFTAPEKDSVFNLVKEIIANPLPHTSGCTEFVGRLELTIEYGRFGEPGSCKQTIAYSGVCDWNKLSDKTMHLHNILRRKIKKIHLGENDVIK